MQTDSRWRIVDGVLYIRDDKPYAHDLKIHDLGHGHTEAVVLPRYGWSESGALSDLAKREYAIAIATAAAEPVSETELLDRAALNRERATRRARTRVRRLAKSKGCTALLTLTYRENMQDRDRMQRDLDVFLKRLRRVVPGFEYVCVFERQKRGAWHAHLAVPRVLSHYMSSGKLVRSYDLIRSMWRAVVGADNGNIDVSRNKAVSRSAAKLAVYLSKYIGKTFDQAEKHVNAFSASMGQPPQALTFRSPGDLAAGIGALYDLLGPDFEGRQAFTLLCDGGGFFLCLSPPSR
jgi:hypothetical protein